MNVLLVSSQPRVTTQATTALVDDDRVQITEVRSPERAIALLDEVIEGEREPFAIVVADNDTQPVGGFYLSREMKARARMGAELPPIVLLVGRQQDEYLARWSEADAWVVKPVDPFDLAEAVASLAGGEAVPALPGVRTFDEAGPVKAAGQPGELPGRRVPGERALGGGHDTTSR